MVFSYGGVPETPKSHRQGMVPAALTHWLFRDLPDQQTFRLCKDIGEGDVLE